MLNKKTIFLLSALTLTTAGIVACSSNSSSGSGSTTTNEFASLPEVTGPVSTNAPTSVRPSSIDAFTASTGVVLNSVGASDFTGKSLQMCENVNYIKEILREAAGPDKILCYMGKMKATGVLPSSLNIADGAVHYVKLLNLPDSGGGSQVPRVKFQIVNNGN